MTSIKTLFKGKNIQEEMSKMLMTQQEKLDIEHDYVLSAFDLDISNLSSYEIEYLIKGIFRVMVLRSSLENG